MLQVTRFIILSLALMTGQALMAQGIATVAGKSIEAAQLVPSAQETKRFAEEQVDLTNPRVKAHYQLGQLTSRVLSTVLEDYAKSHQVEAQPIYVASFVQRFAVDGEVTQELQEIAEREARAWQLDKLLYERFGGTVIFRQDNPMEPIGAYLSLLKLYQSEGKLEFHDASAERAFWTQFNQPYPFVLSKENIQFNHPWWHQ